MQTKIGLIGAFPSNISLPFIAYYLFGPFNPKSTESMVHSTCRCAKIWSFFADNICGCREGYSQAHYVMIVEMLYKFVGNVNPKYYYVAWVIVELTYNVFVLR